VRQTWRRTIGFCLAAGGLLAASAASAGAPAILAPGQSVSVPDFPDSAVVLATQTEPFGGATGPKGLLTEFVVNDTLYSPFGADDLVFAYSLSMSSGNVAKISLGGFGGFQTAVKSCDALACIEGVGLPPDTATRSADGGTVSFLFDTPLTGASSGFVIYTNASYYYDPPGAAIFDSAGDVAYAPTFLPSAAPEPSAWALLITGLTMLGGVLRWRSRGLIAGGVLSCRPPS
jgi:hypothetical protein